MTTGEQDNISKIQQLWQVVTTFTDEAFAAAERKCSEMGLDTNRGLISLEESFINLGTIARLLLDAIEKEKLVQLPLTIQSVLLSQASDVSKFLTSLSGGTDEVVNLVTAVEKLNTSVWQYGLHNLSDQVLGYQKKMNELKHQEVQIKRLVKEGEEALRTKDALLAAVTEATQAKSQIAESSSDVKRMFAEVEASESKVKEAGDKVAALLATVQQQETNANELTGNIKTLYSELTGLGSSIRDFYAQVEENRTKIKSLSDEAANTIEKSRSSIATAINEFKEQTDAASQQHAEALSEALSEFKSVTEEELAEVRKRSNDAEAALTATVSQELDSGKEQLKTAMEELSDARTKALEELQSKSEEALRTFAVTGESFIQKKGSDVDGLIKRIDEQNDRIKDQIDRATGFGLFQSFQKRQEDIAKGKQFWVRALFGLAVASLLVGVWVAYEAAQVTQYGIAFYMKLTLTIPLFYLVGFCTVQYSRERRLEEEYAFKANISISLNPYRELVEKLVNKDDPAEAAKYTAFIIESVNRVFTSPTEQIFDKDEKTPIVTESGFKHVNEIIETVGKLTKNR